MFHIVGKSEPSRRLRFHKIDKLVAWGHHTVRRISQSFRRRTANMKLDSSSCLYLSAVLGKPVTFLESRAPSIEWLEV